MASNVVAGAGFATYLHESRAGRKRSKACCGCAQHAPDQQPLQRSCGRPLYPQAHRGIAALPDRSARCRALHVL